MSNKILDFAVKMPLVHLPPSTTSMNLDPSDPESLFLFFQTQMKDTRSKLSAMMHDQDVRNKRCTDLQAIQSKLTEFEGSGINGTNKDWDGFLKAMQQAKELVGADSEAGKEIQGLIDRATARPQAVIATMNTEEEARDLAKSAGGTYEQNKLGFFEVKAPPGPCAGLTGVEVKSLTSTLKGVTDSLQSESSMQMIRVQQGVEQCSQIVNVCSNVSRKFHDMAMAAISNIRG